MTTLIGIMAALLVLGSVDGQVERQRVPSAERLNPLIPAAITAKYKLIRNAKDWRNPMITVRAEGIEVVSTAILGGRKTVQLGDLRPLLRGLPVTAWPYGRVVLASDIGIVAADRRDDEVIKRNHKAAEEILKNLDVVIDWWPSSLP